MARAAGTQTFEFVADGKYLRGCDTETKGQFETLSVQSWDPVEQTRESAPIITIIEASQRPSNEIVSPYLTACCGFEPMPSYVFALTR